MGISVHYLFQSCIAAPAPTTYVLERDRNNSFTSFSDKQCREEKNYNPSVHPFLFLCSDLLVVHDRSMWDEFNLLLYEIAARKIWFFALHLRQMKSCTVLDLARELRSSKIRRTEFWHNCISIHIEPLLGASAWMVRSGGPALNCFPLTGELDSLKEQRAQ